MHGMKLDWLVVTEYSFLSSATDTEVAGRLVLPKSLDLFARSIYLPAVRAGGAADLCIDHVASDVHPVACAKDCRSLEAARPYGGNPTRRPT